MSTKVKKISEKEIDDIVIAQANDIAQWSKPIIVHPKKSIPIFITPKTALKLQDAARKRHVKNYHRWVEEMVKQHLTKQA